MTTFKERGQAMESKHFRDEELNFKAISRRRKLLGLWAADYMRLCDEDALEYALSIVKFGIDNTEEGVVVQKILKDIQNKGVDVQEEEIRTTMVELHYQAIREIETQFQAGSL